MKKIMNRSFAVLLSLFLFAPVVNANSYRVNADKDSCWRPPSWCVKVEKTRWRGDNFRVTYRNVCQHRVYIRYCNQYKTGKWSCGATGIGGGRASGWDTYKANGRYQYRFIGVLKGSKDWVCAGKVRNWHEPR